MTVFVEIRKTVFIENSIFYLLFTEICDILCVVLKIHKGDWSNGMIGVSKTFGGSSILSSPAIFYIYGPLVKRLRRRPLTAETGVRFPYGLFKSEAFASDFFCCSFTGNVKNNSINLLKRMLKYS